MRRRIALTAVTALLVAFATAAVLVVSAGSAPPAAAVNADGSIPVSLSEWKIDLPSEPVPAGPVVFVERNDGRVDHDLLLVRTDVDPAKLPRGLSGPVPSAAGDVVFGEIHDHAHSLGQDENHLRPGQVRRREVTLEPGNYALICPLEGHYASGQSARLVVRAGA